MASGDTNRVDTAVSFASVVGGLGGSGNGSLGPEGRTIDRAAKKEELEARVDTLVLRCAGGANDRTRLEVAAADVQTARPRGGTCQYVIHNIRCDVYA